MPPPVTSFTARELIDEVRDLHTSFNSRLHPDPLVLRVLSRAQDTLIAAAYERDPMWWTEEVEFSRPDPKEDPVDIPPFRGVVGGRVALRDARTDFRGIEPAVRILTPGSASRSDPARFGVTIEGDRLRFVRGGAWHLVETLYLTITPRPEPLGLDEAFSLYDEAKSALLMKSALALASRGVEAPDGRTLQRWESEEVTATALWLERVEPYRTVKTSYVRDVMG